MLQEVDFLVTPSSPVAAWRIDSSTVTLDGTEYPTRGPGSGMTARCTSPSNATGLPAMSIPCGLAQPGLPIGLQLIGRARRARASKLDRSYGSRYEEIAHPDHQLIRCHLTPHCSSR